MKIDNRGGHNKYSLNESFFHTWSPKMAYVLGFIYADGTIIDARISSRTCYLKFDSKDKCILLQIKQVLQSKHKIVTRLPQKRIIKGKAYQISKLYSLRIGSKAIFKELTKLGLTPSKSLTLNFPKIPDNYFSFFLRGYFDGDGCISYNNKNKRLQVIFTCGSRIFLMSLSNKLSKILDIKTKNLSNSNDAYQLRYGKAEGLKILDYMYLKIMEAPYLDRKYKIYSILNSNLKIKA